MLKDTKLWGILYGVLLTAFTVYVVLDTFVIARTYTIETPVTTVTLVTDTASDETSLVPRETPTTDVPNIFSSVSVSTDTSYTDANISITLTQYREYDTDIYVAEVYVSSPEYLKTALAEDSYGRNVTEKTSEMAERKGAILAINGDYYGSQEKGFVLRNGVLYRSTASSNQEDLVIYQDGSFGIVTEDTSSAEQLLNEGAMQILSFGPALVMNGEIAVTTDEEVGKAKTSNPRTAIGIMDELHYLFVVSDGRTDESEGLTLYQLAEFMQFLGAETAYNLDGGGSSTMYFNGEIVNNPVSGSSSKSSKSRSSSDSSGKERSVSDIVYIGY